MDVEVITCEVEGLVEIDGKRIGGVVVEVEVEVVESNRCGSDR